MKKIIALHLIWEQDAAEFEKKLEHAVKIYDEIGKYEVEIQYGGTIWVGHKFHWNAVVVARTDR